MHDERQEGQAEAVLRLERLLVRVAHPHDVAHVDLRDGADVGRGLLRQHHVLGDDLAQRRHRDDAIAFLHLIREIGGLRARSGRRDAVDRRGRPNRSRRRRGCRGGAPLDVALRHAPAHAGRFDAVQVDARFGGRALRHRRRARRRRRRGLGLVPRIRGLRLAVPARGRLRDRRLRLLLGRRLRRRCGRAASHDRHQRGAHRNRLAFRGQDALDHAGFGRGDLGVDLVGADFDERLVALDAIAFLHEPLRDRAFDDALAERRKFHRDRHRVLRSDPLARPRPAWGQKLMPRPSAASAASMIDSESVGCACDVPAISAVVASSVMPSVSSAISSVAP